MFDSCSIKEWYGKSGCVKIPQYAGIKGEWTVGREKRANRKFKPM